MNSAAAWNVLEEERHALWQSLIGEVERYLATVHTLPVAPLPDPEPVRKLLRNIDFSRPMSPEDALETAVSGLTRWQVHTSHPRYFGLFNPAPTTMGIAADTLVAAFNPQMAAWSHNPFAAEVERHLVRAFGAKFGYTDAEIDGVFCSGGMEANHTAVLAALVHRFPEFLGKGVRGCSGQPVMYASAESHHSLLKAARMVGIGSDAVRLISVDGKLKLRPDLLGEQMRQDRDRGCAPFLVVATAGTTSAGVIDPLPEMARICREHSVWLHTDAAWGGAAILVPELRPSLDGIEASDSITFDAHKWLSVPMGAGLFLTRRPDILGRTFHVASAYMPKDASGLDVQDPHLHSMQWSRRFIGLKVFLSLLVAGWTGYESAIRHQTAMGRLLRERLQAENWEIVNDTPLPVVCFVDPGGDAERQRAIAAAVVRSGQAWISPTVIDGRTVIRACITNYRSTPEDIEALVQALNRNRPGA